MAAAARSARTPVRRGAVRVTCACRYECSPTTTTAATIINVAARPRIDDALDAVLAAWLEPEPAAPRLEVPIKTHTDGNAKVSTYTVSTVPPRHSQSKP
eukprot:m.46552 g.46552  ORF g.46552 m.46552 type:complete len:99 (+) comp6779_c0_seq1:2605-2901(+)